MNSFYIHATIVLKHAKLGVPSPVAGSLRGGDSHWVRYCVNIIDRTLDLPSIHCFESVRTIASIVRPIVYIVKAFRVSIKKRIKKSQATLAFL